MVLVHSASIQDGRGGYQTLQKLFDKIKLNIHNRWCRLKLIWADGAYVPIVKEVRKHFGWKLDIVRRSDKAKGFKVLPHRWIVERTLVGWVAIVVHVILIRFSSDLWFISPAFGVC